LFCILPAILFSARLNSYSCTTLEAAALSLAAIVHQVRRRAQTLLQVDSWGQINIVIFFVAEFSFANFPQWR
jgi:hypothetical protein